MIVMLLCVAVAQTATDSTVDLPDAAEVVAAFVKAKGGEERLKQTRSYRLQMEIRVDGRKTADSEILQTSGRHRTTHTLPDGSQIAHGTDGNVVWFTGPDGRAFFLEGDERDEYLRHNLTLHESLEWKDHYPDIRCTGRVNVDGRPAWQLEFRPEKGRTVWRYFDVQSGLYVQEKITDDDGAEVVYTITDYRRVAGVLVPHKRVARIGNHTTEYLLKHTQNNVDPPNDAFTAPESPLHDRIDQ